MYTMYKIIQGNSLSSHKKCFSQKGHEATSNETILMFKIAVEFKALFYDEKKVANIVFRSTMSWS